MAKKGLHNPAALALLPSAIDGIKETTSGFFKIQEKQVDFFQKNAKPIVITLGVIGLAYFGPRWYKAWRADNYAKKNIGKPEVTAAAIIYNSFTRFEPKGFLSLVLPTFDISTDEAALFNIARQVSSITEVANAYDILFDRNLLEDIQGGLNTTELNTFMAIINGKDGNPDIGRTILAGSTVYNAKKETIAVKEAKQIDGVWQSTNNLFANIAPNEKIGTVVNSLVYEPTGSRFYIVKKCTFGVLCDHGLVWDNEIRDSQI